MGYSLSIGEAIIDYSIWEDDYKESSVSIAVEAEHHETAPAFGEPTDHSNQRWPSYTQWHEFCKFTQLTDVFYQDKDFRGGHPGVFPITKTFQRHIDLALKAHKMRHPNAQATYEREANLSEEEFMADGSYCRLEWLKYWTDWALINCKHPVFCNT